MKSSALTTGETGFTLLLGAVAPADSVAAPSLVPPPWEWLIRFRAVPLPAGGGAYFKVPANHKVGKWGGGTNRRQRGTCV